METLDNDIYNTKKKNLMNLSIESLTFSELKAHNALQLVK